MTYCDRLNCGTVPGEEVNIEIEEATKIIKPYKVLYVKRVKCTTSLTII